MAQPYIAAVAAQNPINDDPAWGDDARPPGASIMRIVPRPQTNPSPTCVDVQDGRVSAVEWHLMLDAVRLRLKAAPDDPATLAAVVAECADALEHLQTLRPPP